MKSISLKFTGGSSNKEYHLQIIPVDDKFVVNAQFGRIGNALQTTVKTPKPVSLEEAIGVYDAIVKEKTSKGYVITSDTKDAYSQSSSTAPQAKKLIFVPQLLNEIDNPDFYIENDEYLVQRKEDGVKLIAESVTDVRGINKKGFEVPLTDDVRDALPPHTSIDGEFVGGVLKAVDLLHYMTDIKEMNCAGRIKMLQEVSATFGSAIQVTETAFTKEEKIAMFAKAKKENWEGIVIKKKTAQYRSGRPASGGDYLKFKFWKTGTFFVANITEGKRSVGLEAIDENKQRVYIGKTTISPNKDIPPVGAIVEVSYLYCYKGGCLFQPEYLSDRSSECDETDCTTKQLVYKKDDE